ncbi:flavin-containing monooxygenase [Pseudonocardia halophobica]|uniref:flavin-containing monooxygenase n=1 Tax=Pseudonocardia halophobica TaxID=29401 RepID=UPI003D9088FA
MTERTRLSAADLDLVVIGAGFSGLAMLHRARRSGLTTRVFEAGGDVGGAWYWNRYPGARTDSESHYYCLSFSKELVDEWSWSERYASQPEVRRYLEFVADRFDLRRDITFDSRVTSLVYDEQAAVWTVTTDSGEQVRSRFVVTAIGLLTKPNVPDFPGLADFAGELLITSRWPDGADLAGKRVGVVGTGSTGVQVVPIAAETARSVTVFQRTPNYVVPAHNRALDAADVADLKRRYLEIRDKARAHSFAMPFEPGHGLTADFTAEERNRIYEEGWATGGFHFLFETFDDITVDEEANESAAEFIRSKIREIVEDPETAELLCPKGYPYGGKRPPVGHHYYEAFNRDTVELVDVSRRGTPIESVTPAGLRTADGREHALDVLVLATGFDAITGGMDEIDVRGRNGRTLREEWAAGPTGFLGFGVHGFPNLLAISGPGSPFANIPVCLEKNVEWIGDLLDHVDREGIDSVEATEEAAADWGRRVHDAAFATLLPRGESVNTWFLGANIEGKPFSVGVWFGGANVYFDVCDEVAAQGYPGWELTSRRD